MTVRHTAALGSAQVDHEVEGGTVVGLSPVDYDFEDLRVYGVEGPTISINVGIVGHECGGSIGVSHYLTQSESGWEATAYVVAEC